jgi:AraC-like DNA-binding protein
MNYVGPRRKLHDQITTDDVDAYLKFISLNLCAVSGLQRDQGRAPPGAPFEADAHAYSVGDYSTARLVTHTNKVAMSRVHEDIRSDSERRYVVCLPIAGEIEVQQQTVAERCNAGAVFMLSGSEPFSVRQSGASEMLALLLPQSFVEERLVRAEELCCRQVSKPGGVSGLVRASVVALQEHACEMSESDLRKAILIVSELVVLALGNLGDVKSSTSPVRSANLMRAKRIIRAKCDNPDLTLADVAAECGLSLRYLHDLFRDDGRTFREYIMSERLRRARRMLEIGSPLNTKVTEVCLASGFSNLSHFSTAFRRAFSISPSEVLRRG